MKQVFVAPKSAVAANRFEALVYLSRKEIEAELIEDEDFLHPFILYICGVVQRACDAYTHQRVLQRFGKPRL